MNPTQRTLKHMQTQDDTLSYLYSVIEQAHESGFHCDECAPDHASEDNPCPLLATARRVRLSRGSTVYAGSEIDREKEILR